MKKTNSQDVKFDPELTFSEQEIIHEELRILDDVLLGIVKEQGCTKRKKLSREIKKVFQVIQREANSTKNHGFMPKLRPTKNRLNNNYSLKRIGECILKIKNHGAT